MKNILDSKLGVKFERSRKPNKVNKFKTFVGFLGFLTERCKQIKACTFKIDKWYLRYIAHLIDKFLADEKKTFIFNLPPLLANDLIEILLPCYLSQRYSLENDVKPEILIVRDRSAHDFNRKIFESDHLLKNLRSIELIYDYSRSSNEIYRKKELPNIKDIKVKNMRKRLSKYNKFNMQQDYSFFTSYNVDSNIKVVYSRHRGVEIPQINYYLHEELQTLLDKINPHKIFLIGHLTYHGDFFGRQMENESRKLIANQDEIDRGFDVKKLKETIEYAKLEAVATKNQIIKFGGEVFERRRGDLLDSEIWDGAKLHEKIQESEIDFAKKFQQSRHQGFDSIFDTSKLRFWTGSYKQEGELIQSWDLSRIDKKENSAGKSNCWTAVTNWRRIGQASYLMSFAKFRNTEGSLIKQITDHINSTQPTTILFEKNGVGSSVYRALTQELNWWKKWGSRFIRVFVFTKKLARAERIKCFLDKGLVYLPLEAEKLEELIKDFKRYPNGTCNDLVDSVVQYLIWIDSKSQGLSEH